MTEGIEDEIRGVASKIIEVPAESMTLDAHFVEDLGADSMMALEILAALEKKYGIVIPEDELPKLYSLRQAVDLVGRLKQ